MLKYLFLVCLYNNQVDFVGYKKAEKLNEMVECDKFGQRCYDAYLVKFNGVKRAQVVGRNDCLFITKENKNEIQYQD